MKTILASLSIGLLALFGSSTQAAPLGTAFTYQGRLQQNGQPTTGSYQMTFWLYAGAVGGVPIASNVVPVVQVTDGLFTRSVDFGPNRFTGDETWLAISMATNGSSAFTLLQPRTRLAPVPNAIYSSTAGTVSNASIRIGQLATLSSPAQGQVLGYNGSSLVWQPAGGASTVWTDTGTSAFYDGGNVGIGTATPQSRLVVAQANNHGVAEFVQETPGTHNADVWWRGGATPDWLFSKRTADGSGDFWIYRPNEAVLVLKQNGNVGIGTPDPHSKLEVIGQDAVKAVGPQPFFTLADSNAGYVRSRIQGVNGEISLQTEGFINGSAPNGYVHINGAGNMSVATLTIRGGADLAEPFPMKEEHIEKGSVVVIDHEHPGRLKCSTRAYDTRVAGIVSGGNGINPGIALKQEGALDQGENVALTGRVYVQADADHGAITPGDLLTTSDTPGHAMKVTDHGRAQGAILGKAMTGLTQGKGMVLVLVTLQ